MVAASAASVLVLTACGGDDGGDTDSGGGGGETAAEVGKVGVILPDTASSARWETADRPLLQEAFKAAGVEADIQNAQGDKARFQTIADGMISLRRQRSASSRTWTTRPEARRHQEGQRRRHPGHRLRPAHPRRRRLVLRLVRQRQGRRGHRRGPAVVPQASGTTTGGVVAAQRRRRPTTTPRCSSRATRRF